MASAPSTPKPVSGRIDRAGRLVAADLELERLQQEAGSRLGAPLALPQLAAIARTARQLGVPVSRRALAASSDHDVDMWVRAVPEGEDIILSIEQWQARPVAGPRLAAFAGEAAAPVTARRWEVDEQLRITAVSPPLADLLGFSLEQAAGQPLTSLFRLQPNEDGSMPLLNGLSARSAFAGQKVGFGTGEAILVVSGQPVFSAGGEFSGFEGSADPPGKPSGAGYSVPDAHVEQLLRAPLDRIIESAGRIVDRSDGPLRNEYAIYAADISAAAHHLLSVVRSMNENPAADARVVDMVELTEEAVGLVESAAIERDIVIALEPVGSCRAHGEARGAMQILVNLIGNAIRYSPAQSAISISFERRDGFAVVNVADNGPGIPAADQERIFERFEQGKSGGPGSGLGLAIARRLARGMGGEIELQSQPGVGSTFTLVLPAAS